MSPEVSILVVAYRNPELTARCLESIFQETRELEFEVLVHDNESGDGTPELIAERFPQVRLSAGEGNLGFARANNRLAERARGRYLLLLNPDTVVLDGAIQRLVGVARRQPRSIPLGGRTLRPDGSVDPSSCWGAISLWSLACFATGVSTAAAGSRLLDPESLGGWARDTPRDVDIVTGCLALVPRDVWTALGGFDETFWLYGEDADLSLRARGAGYQPAITPEATITHVVGASSKAHGPKVVLVLQGKVTLLRKHWRRRPAAAGRLLLLAGVLLRKALEMSLRRPATPDGRPWSHAWANRRTWLAGFPVHVPGPCDGWRA